MEKIYVTEAELTALRLYRNCDRVTFSKYNQKNREAIEFVEILGKPSYVDYDDSTAWYEASRNKVHATAFINKWEEQNE